MSRRPARYTQADLARALAAAEQRGPDWDVVAEPSGAIRLTRSKPPAQSPEVSGSFEEAVRIVL